MKHIAGKTDVVLGMMLDNNYLSGSGTTEPGKDHITKFTLKISRFDEITIPYDAYQLLDMAKTLILKANILIEENKNIGE